MVGKSTKNLRKEKKRWQLLSFFSSLKQETTRGVWAVLLFVAAAILALAATGSAGVVGSRLHEWFSMLLGIGYLLLPLLLLAWGVFLLRSFEGFITSLRIFGASLFFIAALGLLHLIAPDRAGLLGSFIAAPLISLFDTYATLLLLAAAGVISLLIMIDTPLEIRLARLLFWRKNGEVTTFETSPYEEDPPEEIAEVAVEEVDEEPRIAAPIKEATVSSPFAIMPLAGGAYIPPPLSLLEKDRGKPGVGDIKANANIIKRTLQNFGIQVEMDEISIGPSVTRYTLKPAEGVRLSKIIGLNNNLELALAAHPVRIEAPIPGKSLVGIEVPNSAKATVGLATLFSSVNFQESDKPLLLTLGRDIAGVAHFADLGKMPHLLIAGATGSGKTCSKDTYVFSEKGVLTFEELCPLPLNSEIDYSLQVATRDGVETTSKNYNNGLCDFYKITTNEGLSIEVTDEHPLWVMKDSTMRWQNGGSIQIGEYVAIARGSKLFGTETQINFTPAPNKTNKAREIKTPTKMTKELGLFIGLLTADGGLTVKNRVVYTQANKEVLAVYKTLLKNLFGITTPAVAKSGQSNKAKDVIVNSKHLKDFLTHLGVKPVGAREKEIPKSIRQSGPEIIRAFIQGLIRNDGHISAKGLEITLATEKLLKQLQIILLNFGIVSSIYPKKVKNYKENNYWRLTIYGAEFVIYAKEIGFLTNEEEFKSRQLLALRRNANKNIIPTLSPLLKKLYLTYRKKFARLTNMGWQYQTNVLVPKYAFRSLASYNSGVRNPSYEALGRILTFYEPLALSAEYQKIAEIREDNFYWAKVVTIKKTAGVGYDFEVPGSNSFVGNGFVNHNSVTIHAIITSFLYRNSPADLRFILIDPKRVELTLYNNIPHLLTPVITDAKKTVLALKWLGKEMDRRYDILEAESVRDISSYHKNILGPALLRAQKSEAALPEMMPRIVVVIDELADIMQTYPKELEAAVVRLAQMSRAVGIHLILSTQRPSVNVITGLIKANIPARIALQVASQIDSRTILDGSGAEKLLGAGDMLYLSSDMGKPMRVQSAYISEQEVKRVSKFIIEHNGAAVAPVDFVSEGTRNAFFSASLEDGKGLEDDDDLYDEARVLVTEAGKASTSYLQRRLRIGYARAARLMDMLEERAVIGPADGARPRGIISSEDAPEHS